MSLFPGISVATGRAVRTTALLVAGVLVCGAVLNRQALASEMARPNDLMRAVVIVTTFDQQGLPLLQGSGFFIAPDRIVTNLHVINQAASIQIKTFAGKTLVVQTVIATDARADLALLQVAGRAEAVLEVDPATPSEGERVMLLSNPQGSNWKVTRGAVGRVWKFSRTGSRLQITAGVFPGSSGGPVLNKRGQVVGIAVMRINSSDDLNFAVPAASLKKLQSGRSRPVTR